MQVKGYWIVNEIPILPNKKTFYKFNTSPNLFSFSPNSGLVLTPISITVAMNASGSGIKVYNDSTWFGPYPDAAFIDFGESYMEVPDDFYIWLCQNAVCKDSLENFRASLVKKFSETKLKKENYIKSLTPTEKLVDEIYDNGLGIEDILDLKIVYFTRPVDIVMNQRRKKKRYSSNPSTKNLLNPLGGQRILEHRDSLTLRDLWELLFQSEDVTDLIKDDNIEFLNPPGEVIKDDLFNQGDPKTFRRNRSFIFDSYIEPMHLYKDEENTPKFNLKTYKTRYENFNKLNRYLDKMFHSDGDSPHRSSGALMFILKPVTNYNEDYPEHITDYQKEKCHRTYLTGRYGIKVCIRLSTKDDLSGVSGTFKFMFNWEIVELK